MIEGSIVAIVTPMDTTGAIDFSAFDALLEWHIECGTDAIVVVGTTGESATLTAAEHCDMVKHCVDTVAGRIPVVAGTGSNNTEEAIYFTRSALEHGADACLLVTPYYNRPSQEGLYQHFKSVAESVDIPQILYNVPGRTACDLLPETVLRLAEISNIIGVKEATGDLSRSVQLIESCGDDFAVYSGEDALAVDILLAGGKGNISVTANVAPALMHELCRVAMTGDVEAANKLNEKLVLLHQNLFLEANPVPVKWALSELGFIQKGIRLPLVELAQSFHVNVQEAMKVAELTPRG